MRIALLTAAASWSGVEVHTIQLASALKQKGHQVTIFELGRQGYTGIPLPLPCPVNQLDLGFGSRREVTLDSLSFSDWRRIFKQIQTDLAISVKGTFKFGSLAMEAAARLCFPRFLVIEHLHAPLQKITKGIHFKGLVPSFNLWWYRQKFSGYLRSLFPNKVICVSKALASTLEQDYHYPQAKLAVAHSGVDTDLFVSDPVARDLAREAWGIPHKGFVFGTVGRLSPMKNHGQLIGAFSRLCRTTDRDDLWLVIVGEGPQRTSLEALSKSSSAGDRIVFAGFSAAPQKILPGFDVFCFPSTTGESLGIALLEAMSCGCPAIASAVGGVPEILNDPQLGWLIPMGDEDALMASMGLALESDSQKLQQMGASAREHVIRHFSAREKWGELVRLIESMSPGDKIK
ncbi:MAG: glycosyltransferase family 4 protein [Desulfuromonadaceae bacterium]|nr:glycosyltransferase family 4 protein [Desulfuromonadaceae bacterium]